MQANNTQCSCNTRYLGSILTSGVSATIGAAIFSSFEVALWGYDPSGRKIEGAGQMGGMLGFCAGLTLAPYLEKCLFNRKCQYHLDRASNRQSRSERVEHQQKCSNSDQKNLKKELFDQEEKTSVKNGQNSNLGETAPRVKECGFYEDPSVKKGLQKMFS